MKNTSADQASPADKPQRKKRSPGTWGSWLRDKMGFQRQMLNALQRKPMYQGTADESQVARRRARNKLATKTRTMQSMARRGKR